MCRVSQHESSGHALGLFRQIYTLIVLILFVFGYWKRRWGLVRAYHGYVLQVIPTSNSVGWDAFALEFAQSRKREPSNGDPTESQSYYVI